MRRPSSWLPAVAAGRLILNGWPLNHCSVVEAQAPAVSAEVDSSPTSAGGAAPASGTDEGRFIGGAYLRDAAFKLRSADFFYLQTVVGF